MSDITITLPGGGTETIQLPDNVPNIPPALVAEIQKDIDKAEPKLAQDLEAGLKSGKFHNFNHDIQKLVKKILKDAESYPFVCFGAGTMIRTTRGDVPVERLAKGDLVVTASGQYRPIRWLGHRVVDCRNHPRPRECMPVRIVAGAFGDGRPARDLLVSPGHALCVDMLGEVLIMASTLTNGTTIRQEDIEEMTYWHVELESHDLLLAENMPAESYLEMGNRTFFAESDVVGLDASPDMPIRTHADFCRPFHAEGAMVEAVRAQLQRRAMGLGWRLEAQGLGDLHLVADGIRLQPTTRGLTARFNVPSGAHEVWLVSKTGMPASIKAASSDRRRLGLYVQALVIDDGFDAPRAVAVDDPRLSVGFHDVERKDGRTKRWTDGCARLPSDLWAGIDGDFSLRVTLAAQVLPRWVEPVGAGAEGLASPLVA